MAICPYCDLGAAVEIGGLWVHKRPDRWISCNLKNERPQGEDQEVDKRDSHLHEHPFTQEMRNNWMASVSAD